MSDNRVLIVEDEVRIAEILRDYLTQSGFAVEHLERGDGVIEKVQADPPDLILLDIMLPGKDGLEICKGIRQFSNMPIIMISARVEELDRLLGLELGADDYICKPFSPREVVARVKVAFRRIAAAKSQEKGAQNSDKDGQSSDKNGQNSDKDAQEKLFVIDAEQERISFKGTVLELTRTEYRLLSTLISRPGRVYPRAQLVDLCAQSGEPAFDRVIDSHIKNLRKKIAKVLGDTEVIHSVYGVGYRFEVV